MDVYAMVRYPHGETEILRIRMDGPGSIVDAITEHGAARYEWTLLDARVEF